TAAAAVWACGSVFLAARWLRGWSSLHRLRPHARPGSIQLPIPVRISSAGLEPGVFGVFRQVLLLPERLRDRLDVAQFEGLLAHELCPVLSRDNLTGVVHAAVQAIFWFHPAVWWIGRRLIEERERACDED